MWQVERRKCEDDIKLDLKINTFDDMDWINHTETRNKWRFF